MNVLSIMFMNAIALKVQRLSLRLPIHNIMHSPRGQER